VWTFVLDEQGGSTRLISRNRLRLPTLGTRLAMFPLEVGSLEMIRKMHRGVKRRAELLATEPEATDGRPTYDREMTSMLPEATVGDVMLRRPKTLPADTTVADALRAFGNSSLKLALLVDGDRFCGAVTAIPAEADPAEPASRYIDESTPLVSEHTTVEEALGLLDERAHGRLVVLDGDRLVGLVCLTADGRKFCGTSEPCPDLPSG
jgi:CBS domain-containing protein